VDAWHAALTLCVHLGVQLEVLPVAFIEKENKKRKKIKLETVLLDDASQVLKK